MEAPIIYNQSVSIMKDVDTTGNKVAFYYATFDDIDSHGRMMDKSAFRRTIKNNSDKWYHLFNHDNSKIVGKVVDAGTDTVGAFVVSKINNTQQGKDLVVLYNDGVIKEHSFGFQIVHSVQNSDHELVKEAKVLEVSSVTFAANPEARLISFNDAFGSEIYEIKKQLSELKSLFPIQQSQDSKLKDDELLNFINEFKY